MCRKAYISMFLALALLGQPLVPQALADIAPSREYQIKAAFLYNFIKFVDWPKNKMPEPNEPIILGIIGKDPFGNTFELVKDKQIKGRKLLVKRFKSIVGLKRRGESGKRELYWRMEALKKCHLLFVCSSEKEAFKDIVNALKNQPILTVGDSKDFFKADGIINFVMEKKKLRFEINMTCAKKAELKIRSQLLRLAKRVIK
jgi:hypothetical protein